MLRVLSSAREQLEIGGVLRQNRQHIVAIQESHEGGCITHRRAWLQMVR